MQSGACLRIEAREGGKPGRQILAVRVARPGLLFETIELCVEHRALKFAQPVVARDDVMLVPDASGDAAAVLNRAARRGQPVVVGGDDAALARREILARLEGE